MGIAEKTDRKLISVLMSVYNTEEIYLREAIESILNQTFKEFQFVLIDDSSDEKTTFILKEYVTKDKRIKLIRNNENLGLTKSLNRGLCECEGKYIARMDSDDVSMPKRLEKQVEYMENHPNVAVLGTGFHDSVRSYRIGCYLPTEWRRVQMLGGNSGIVHSTAMLRKKFLDENMIAYDERIKRSQDYKLWVDILEAGGIMNIIPNDLLYWREHEGQISKKYDGEQKVCVIQIRAELLSKAYPQISANEWIGLLNNARLDSKQLLDAYNKIEKYNIEGQDGVNNKYNKRILHNELKYIYKKDTGKSITLSVSYVLYRIRRAWYTCGRKIY